MGCVIASLFDNLKLPKLPLAIAFWCCLYFFFFFFKMAGEVSKKAGISRSCFVCWFLGFFFECWFSFCVHVFIPFSVGFVKNFSSPTKCSLFTFFLKIFGHKPCF